ncbi:MAG TPA: isoprenylcysteine carboxylmethyltransferase family protein [Anaerolineales bacterium]|nr:isoprenylcysteine carboxylmethyltransferase family protein [Anaerolineales bacterium]
MPAQTKGIKPRTLVQMFIIVVAFPLLPMIISGDWAWWEVWAYALISMAGFFISRLLAAQHYPDILEERARSMGLQDAKSWDKILAPILALGGIFILVVAGLDRLFGWTTPLPLTTKIIAIIVIILGFLLGSWALIENRFFSGVVRIQKDRGQHVISSGPYRYIRHPGYAGALWTYLATPLLLDSAWAFIPAILLIGVIALRTALEDKTLQEELPGYREFAQKTRYRLVPGIW